MSAEEIYKLTKQMATLNEQQSFAEENILDGHNVVLTGQARTGKIFFLKDIVSTLKFRESKYSLLCTSSIYCMQYFDISQVSNTIQYSKLTTLQIQNTHAQKGSVSLDHNSLMVWIYAFSSSTT